MNRTIKMALAAALMAVMPVFAQTQAFRWVDTWTLSGKGCRQTEPFQILSEDWRMDYQPSGKVPFTVAVHDVVTGRETLLVSQTKKDRAQPGTTSGEGTMQLAYLAVTADSSAWKLKLRQYLDKPNEWRFINWEPYVRKLMPFGSWNGQAGERELSIEVKDRIGRFTVKQNQNGRLSVSVVDEGGQCILRHVTTVPGQMDSWFYKPGVYVVRISAIDTDWSLFVETVEK